MGACQTGGTVIDWVMKAQGVSFRHAVELLRAGAIPVVAPGTAAGRHRAPRSPPPVDDRRPTTPRPSPRSSPTTTRTLHRVPRGPGLPGPPQDRRPGGHRAVPSRLRQPDPRAPAARPSRPQGRGGDPGPPRSASASTDQWPRAPGRVDRRPGHRPRRAPSPNSTAESSTPTCARARRSTSTCPAPTEGSGTRRGSSAAR